MAGQTKGENNKVAFYPNSNAHLKDELKKLDLLIKRGITIFRLKLRGSPESGANTMFISHAEIDRLLSKDTFYEFNTDLEKTNVELKEIQRDIDVKVKESLKRGILLALPRLVHIFGMSDIELQIVILCLAPELDRKYDKLYAYLQDDITRKRPSLDLALDLLCQPQSERWAARSLLSGSKTIFRTGIIQKVDDPSSPSGSSGLSQFWKLDPRILNYILGDNSIDERLTDYIKKVLPLPLLDNITVNPLITAKVSHLVQSHFSAHDSICKKLVLYLYGPYGAGKQELAQFACKQLHRPLLVIDVAAVLSEEHHPGEILRLIFREGVLLEAAIYLFNLDSFIKEDDKSKILMEKLFRLIGEYGKTTFLAGEKAWPHKAVFEGIRFQSLELSIPDFPLRKAAWERALISQGIETGTEWSARLAEQFHITPGQIRDAAEFARQQLDMNQNQQNVTLVDLFNACRSQSNQNLNDIVSKIESHCGWKNLVLPEERLKQLREIANQLKHRNKVFREWGFGENISRGKGLSVLFSGPPGTGKTMAAEVIAHELQLDLYKIDLSSVVSKYIGETEKNLAHIFQEAESSNAILFFDEADALFGKRTKVSDAHDRYANIETSYLLQKMEEYEGMVILASNLRENMDEAFTRRIRFIVEFPFPDESSRSRIWQTHFPRQAPIAADVDFGFLSKQFQIAGGNIKNIVLNAAFLAAENGGVIGMDHIIHGVKTEFEKMGKLWNERDIYKPVGLKQEN